jgi:hypothetical protein
MNGGRNLHRVTYCAIAKEEWPSLEGKEVHRLTYCAIAKTVQRSEGEKKCTG